MWGILKQTNESLGAQNCKMKMFLANWNIWVDVEGSLVLFMKQNLLQINLLDFPKYIQLSTLKKVMVKVISISGHPLWT